MKPSKFIISFFISRLDRFVVVVSLFSWMSGSSSSAAAAPGRAQMQNVAENNTAFALDLYAQLKSQPGNLFFSPCSISTSLAMTYAGAAGQTEKQMAQVFHFGKDQAHLHAGMGELQRQIVQAGKDSGAELSIANALWAQRGYAFRKEFLKVARDEYGANVNQADFATGAEPARHEINGWVAQQTKNKIQNILPPGSLDPLTRLVLANAIYFKGLWATPYSKAATSPQPFHVSSSTQVDAPLMHHIDTVKYMENNEYQAVELPYRSNELSMVILLPRRLDGCTKLEEELRPALLSRSLSQMKQRQVEIFLPRFKLESSFDLNGVLAGMGMRDAFGAQADFSRMDGKANDLYISGVFHKAWGEVNEEGTEAAAATVVAITKASAEPQPPPPPVFRADHPFVFFIREVKTGSLLFVGRLTNPEA